MSAAPTQPPEHPRDEILARGRFVRLLQRDGWEFIDEPGIHGVVVIVAVTGENNLLLVEQHRTPLDGHTLELPAGVVGNRPDGERENFGEAARRELEEETGYRAAELEPLASGPVSPGRARYYYHFFRASFVTRVHAGGGDSTEQITVHEAPLDRIEEWLARQAAQGLHVDPKIYAGLYFLSRKSDR